MNYFLLSVTMFFPLFIQLKALQSAIDEDLFLAIRGRKIRAWSSTRSVQCEMRLSNRDENKKTILTKATILESSKLKRTSYLKDTSRGKKERRMEKSNYRNPCKAIPSHSLSSKLLFSIVQLPYIHKNECNLLRRTLPSK